MSVFRRKKNEFFRGSLLTNEEDRVGDGAACKAGMRPSIELHSRDQTGNPREEFMVKPLREPKSAASLFARSNA